MCLNCRRWSCTLCVCISPFKNSGPEPRLAYKSSVWMRLIWLQNMMKISHFMSFAKIQESINCPDLDYKTIQVLSVTSVGHSLNVWLGLLTSSHKKARVLWSTCIIFYDTYTKWIFRKREHNMKLNEKVKLNCKLP